MKLSIVCPVCNERDNLRELIDRVFASLPDLFNNNNAELIFVDDGSDDGSRDLLENFLKKDSSIKLLIHNKRRGQAAALSSGFLSAAGDIVITMDADLQVFPEDLRLFLNKMDEGFDFVNGARTGRQDGVILKLSSRLFSFLLSAILNITIRDATSNFTATRREFVKDLHLLANDHRYIISIIKSRGATKITEVKVRHAIRQKGKSKYKISKIVFAIPELFLFYSRLKKGYYCVS
ncbi:MAG: glycosyltransferase [Candidatus Omnitrophica bacterium]|jgi:glycosyltransferase involved in cell wall biosynthesis|nr:glycosyltransferase [Candidatus Omnitrophota bacterium]